MMETIYPPVSEAFKEYDNAIYHGLYEKEVVRRRTILVRSLMQEFMSNVDVRIAGKKYTPSQEMQNYAETNLIFEEE